MTPLATENLNLKFEDNVAHIRVKGSLAQDALEAGLDWMDEAAEANDNFNIRVEMAQDDFEDLSEIRSEFTRVGRMLRHAPAAEKCAVLTDSLFLRNSAKVEGAALPGLELNTFDLKAQEVAQNWLRDQPLTEAPSSDQTRAVDTDAGEMAEAVHASAGPAPTELNLVSPSEMKTIEAAAAENETARDNPWDDFRAI